MKRLHSALIKVAHEEIDAPALCRGVAEYQCYRTQNVIVVHKAIGITEHVHARDRNPNH